MFDDILSGLNTRERLLYPMTLQEAPNWRDELQSWDLSDHDAGALVALCRIWSERVAGCVRGPLSEVLATRALVALKSWLGTLAYPPEWQWVLTVDGSLPRELPFERARSLLGCYIRDWLHKSNPDAGWTHKTLRERFVAVSVALDFLARNAPGDELLQVLATRNPSLTPVFDGLDLWIQRKALHACVAHWGVRFIDDHWDELRVEAILSIVVGNFLRKRELTALHSSLRARSSKPWNLGVPELRLAIQSRIK